MDTAAGVSFVRHEHADSMEWEFAGPDHEILVWRRGSAHAKEFEFESGPRGAITPAPGNVWVIPAGFRTAAIAQHCACDIARITLPPPTTRSTELRPTAGTQDRLLHYLVERIASTATRVDAVGKLLHESLLNAAHMHIVDIYSLKPRATRTTPRTLSPESQRLVLERLHQAWDPDVTLQELAATTGLTVDQFGRAFAATFHVTPHRYLRDRKLSRARHLLSTTTMTITDISAAAGFSSPSHFATTFKRHIGVSPSHYRTDTT
ncbi:MULTISPECIES: helix-turn-helix transcriptional regulator [Tsukamurella]|uniref:Helix-turn-helix domain-containing protein n=2 Tax=Tsukamurella TaxID=2060 RepID=A0A5C5RYK4_9ACTN|nr:MULTISPECIES: AraC family transcriptional regulator [Tsukamurella]NMD56548.1 helix-turn-helix transcriptional regulator [Tsukamurella columbiensis]TWS27520.1 helix-turn-helix domain-containing protein [Tsukamurella conjunctivitidis]